MFTQRHDGRTTAAPRRSRNRSRPRLRPSLDPLEEKTLLSLGVVFDPTFGSAVPGVVHLTDAPGSLAAYQNVNDVATDPAGNVYAAVMISAGASLLDTGRPDVILSADASTNVIAKYDPSGSLVWAVKTELPSVHRLLWEPSTQALFCLHHGATSTLVRYRLNADTSATPIDEVWQQNVTADNDVDLAADAAGNVYLTSAFGTFEHAASDGRLLRALPGAPGRGIAVEPDGSAIYVTGTFSGRKDFDPGPNRIVVNATSYTAYVQKLDGRTGNLLWYRLTEKVKGYNQSISGGKAVAISPTDGSVYVLGSFGVGPVDFQPGSGITKLDPATGGLFLWKLTRNGGFVLANNKAGYVANGRIVLDVSEAPGRAIITDNDQVAGFNMGSGALLWSEAMPGADPLGMAVDAQGRIVIGGIINETATFGGSTIEPTGLYDGFVARLVVTPTATGMQAAVGGSEELAGLRAAAPIEPLFTVGGVSPSFPWTGSRKARARRW